MKDLYNREIHIGDICVFTDKHGILDSRPIWELHSDDDCPENDYVEIADYHETLTKKAKEIIDITAIEREVREQQILNSVKALDIKPNDRVIASLNPNQMPMREVGNIFNQMKKTFPDNKVSLVIGLDVSIEQREVIKMMKLTKEVSVFDPFVFTERRLYFMQFANDNKEVGFEGVYLCKTVEETKATFITIAQSQGISPKEFYIDNSNYQRFMEIKPMNVMTGFDTETGSYTLKAVIDWGMDVESKGNDVNA